MATVTDRFGIQRERDIESSGIRKIFTPHTPVNSVALFLGRANEVKKIIAQLNTPGQHSLLFGDRGVGKSSLANIAPDLLFQGKVVRGNLYKCRCDSYSTFEHMLVKPLREVGIDLRLTETSEEHNEGGSASIGVSVGFKVGAGIRSDRKVTSKSRPFDRPLSPSRAAELLADVKGLLVIDEFDTVRKDSERRKVAEFIKHLSDARADLKVLVIGIGASAADLIKGHQSVERCLKETRLKVMPPEELRDIVLTGAKKAKLNFESAVVDAIVKLSRGYPHFTHLLALKCAEEGIVRHMPTIPMKILQEALTGAAEDAEGTLRDAYEAATMSYSTEEYRNILCAAAMIPGHTFTAEQLRQSYKRLVAREITQGALNNYFKRLVAHDGQSILDRRSKGVYSFRDPRMPSFVRIKNQLL